MTRFGWTLLLLAGCTPSDRAATPAPIAPTVPAEPAPVASPEVPVEEPKSIPAPPSIGIPGARAPSRTGLKKNREGLAALRDDNVDEAIRLFDAAVEADPEYTMARYNLACATSRGGDLSRASTELEVALARDPARILSRLESDSDLDALRGSEHWSGLLAFAERVRTQVDYAIDHGMAT
ncbi:MAG: tetratricopeptide repeat protein, partial [Myxococcota bacterium]